MTCIPYTYTLPSLERVSSERRVFPPETLVIPPLPPLQTFEKKRKKNPPRLFRLPLYSPPSSRALVHLPPRFIAFVFVPSPIPLRPGTLNATKRATSSSRCLRCGAGGSSFVDGIAKRCRDTLGERGDGGAGRGGCGEPLEGRSRGEREGGMEEEAPWVVDRGWRKCGTSNSPGLPTPAFPTSSPPSSTSSLKGGRARALHPPFANSSSRSIPFYRERCGGYRYTTITDTLTDDFVLYNLRLHIARPSFN